MSRDLDEVALLNEVNDIVEGYGLDAIFITADKSEYIRKITPPRNEKRLAPDGNAQEERLVCIVSAKDLPFDIKRLMRMTHRGKNHQLIDYDAIESGDLIQAYKLFLER